MVTPDLGFAHHLYAQHEYYRAIGEYERWLYFNPSDPKGPQVHYFIARAYQEGDRHQEAIPHFERALSYGPSAKLHLSESLLLTHNKRAEALLNELKHDPHPDIRQASNWLLAEYYVEGDRPLLALSALPASSSLMIPTQNLNPWIAGGLSALVPGLGQAYIGRWGDAAFNALTILALGYASYGSLHSNPPLGWTMAGITGLLHAGNIYGAAQAAKATNLTRKQTTIETIDREWKALCPDPKP